MSYQAYGPTYRAPRKSKEEEAAELDELRRKVVWNMEGSTLGPVPSGAFLRVPNEFELAIQSVAVPFKAICTITKEPFSGVAYIVARPQEWCMEYCSLEAWISTLAVSICTHEELTSYIYSGVFCTLDLVRRDGELGDLLVVLEVREAAHVPAKAAIGNLNLWIYWPEEV